ncbi:MAG: phosphate ABC transporter permease subunit PstC [Planctomycetota bacterium]
MSEANLDIRTGDTAVPRSGFRSRMADRVAHLLVLSASVVLILIAIGLVIQLCYMSWPSVQKFGFQFLWTEDWNPPQKSYGAWIFIYGTLVTSAMALLISIPLGLGCAIFLAELAPRWLSDILTFLIELLAAVPSVIFGLLGFLFLVPVLHDHVVPVLQGATQWIHPISWLPGWVQFWMIIPHLFSGVCYGVSMFSAGVVLALMVVPFIVSVSREMLLAVPNDQREAALGLGATRWETTWKVVVPHARVGIFGSIFLSLARALGETMAVTMVIGNSGNKVVTSLLAPGYTIASKLANDFANGSGLELNALMELGLVLFALTILVNAAARLLILATTRKGARR